MDKKFRQFVTFTYELSKVSEEFLGDFKVSSSDTGLEIFF